MNLKPCPFCGSEDVEICNSGEYFYCHCWKCNAMGPDADTRQWGLEAWNNRPNENEDEK